MKFCWRPALLVATLMVAALFSAPCAHAQKDMFRSASARETANGGMNRPIADKWALVIGVSEFSDPTIPSLHYAAKDAQDFADFLVREEHFAADHVRVLLNQKATQREILSELGNKFLPRVVRPDDLVILYYSSHGSPAGKDIRNENFLVAYDTDKMDLWATAIPMQELTRILRERVLANRILIIMDACHSGGGADGARAAEQGANFNLSKLELGDGQYIVSSSSEDQVSYESKRYKNGVFTHQLMDSLRKQQQLGQAIDYSRQSIMDEVQQDYATLQTPVVNRSRWKGNDLVLAAIPFAPRPMPQSVKDLLDADSRKSKPISASVSPAVQTMEPAGNVSVPSIQPVVNQVQPTPSPTTNSSYSPSQTNRHTISQRAIALRTQVDNVEKSNELTFYEAQALRSRLDSISDDATKMKAANGGVLSYKDQGKLEKKLNEIVIDMAKERLAKRVESK